MLTGAVGVGGFMAMGCELVGGVAGSDGWCDCLTGDGLNGWVTWLEANPPPVAPPKGFPCDPYISSL